MRILLVDDDPFNLDTLATLLEGIAQLEVVKCRNGREALNKFINEPFPLIISDLKMPFMNGLELIKEINKLPTKDYTKIILLTGYGELDSAVQALREGAYDYLMKPVEFSELYKLIERRQKELESELDINDDYILSNNEHNYKNLPDGVLQQGAYFELTNYGRIGIFSKEMKNILAMCLTFHNDRTIPVLIEGESGTGKELIMNIIHHGVSGSKKPLVKLNCSAISANLFESELFGYEGGAYTGAKGAGMAGKLELANGGTLFLDEIGDMPLEMQPKLLRVIEEKEFYKVGGNKRILLDIRIIAATNRPLKNLLKNGSFRRDLFHRLNGGWTFLPPLRELKSSIAPLAQMFLLEFSLNRDKNFKIISKEAIKFLEEYPWDGNVRELRNAIERVVLLYNEIELRPEHLNFLEYQNSQFADSLLPVLNLSAFRLPDNELNLNEFEDEIIKKALDKFNGNKSQTARYLGITRSSFLSKIK